MNKLVKITIDAYLYRDSQLFLSNIPFLNEVANFKDFRICQLSVELFYKIWKIFKQNLCVSLGINLLPYFFNVQF